MIIKKSSVSEPRITKCPCCGCEKFTQGFVLWDSLIKEWKLSRAEVRYIDRQQGLTCIECISNLRSMNLAAAIMSCYGFNGTFQQFVSENKSLKILEINEAGNLSKFLKKMPGRKLVNYPDIDMMNMKIKSNSYDLVVHSDTLEHISDPVKAISETRRILKPGGFTCYTIPIIVDRLTKLRTNETKSYHGSPGNSEYLVNTEYGCNMWSQIFQAGFEQCKLHSIDYPASVAIIGIKQIEKNHNGSKSNLFSKISIHRDNHAK